MHNAEGELKAAVEAAAARAEVVRAVERVYEDVQAAIDERKPPCAISGRCCRFEEYGHRLYVTTIELAGFVRQQTGTSDPAWDATGCPFQRGKLCTVHPARPFGCRIFFCDPGSTEWQNQAYERFHLELKRLHEALAVPYFYVEWRQALEELGLASRGGIVPVSLT